MLVLSMLFTALQSGIATVTDIDTGMMDKLLISPIRRSSILLGRVGADAITMVGGLLLTLPALFLTPAFFPRQLLPGWLQGVSNLNPAGYVIETGQRLMTTGNSWAQDGRTLIALAVTAAVLIPASVAAFRTTAR